MYVLGDLNINLLQNSKYILENTKNITKNFPDITADAKNTSSSVKPLVLNN